MSQSTVLFDQKRALATLNSRVLILPTHVGKQMFFIVVGTPTILRAEDQRAADVKAAKTPAANYFDKQIVNVKANSVEALSRKEVRQYFTDAVKAESAGESQAAHDLYNKFLNASQMSFSSILNSNSYRFQSGDGVTAQVISTETKAGHIAIALDGARYKAPEVAAKASFSMADLLIDDEAPAEPVVNPMTQETAKA